MKMRVIKKIKNKTFYKKIFVCFFVTLIICFSFSINQVQASMLGKSAVDSANASEKQFWEKIRIIKSIFPNQIDDVALAATVLYRGSSSSVLSNQYDEDFDKNDYRNQIQSIKNAVNDVNTSISNKKDNETLSFTKSKDDENSNQIDLLTAATIVMLDSSGWFGTYSDENYEKALAGDRLFFNMVDENDAIGNAISEAFNAIFCTAGAVANATLIPIEFGNDILMGEADVFGSKIGKRFYTMTNICAHGFIGGTMQSVRSIKDDDARNIAKQEIAKSIIKLAETYRILFAEQAECIVDPSTIGGVWKQYDSQWGNISLGNSTVTNIGCLLTSVSMLIARSGTQITNLPNGYNQFNPGAFVTVVKQNGGVTSGGAFAWSGFSSLAPNWKIGNSVSLGISNKSQLAQKLSNELSTPAEGQYQKFIVLQIHHDKSSQHWVAVDSVNNNEVYILDPGGGSGNTLDQNYTGWVVDTYRVMYATDIPFGKVGSSTATNLGMPSCTTSGDILIPEEFGHGGYTVTYYLNSDNSWNWSRDSDSGRLYYDYWLPNGANFTNGIATYDGRFLIACTNTFGHVGDKIDFFLEDGTRIPCIMADEKSQVYVAWDHNPANKWGHNNGQNIIEFEVLRSYANSHGTNPGNSSWYPEWQGKRVASAKNLGSIFS